MMNAASLLHSKGLETAADIYKTDYTALHSMLSYGLIHSFRVQKQNVKQL